MLRALREDALDDTRQAGEGLAVAGHSEEQADAGQRQHAHGFGPARGHVLHGIGGLVAPRRVADAHRQIGLAFGALAVHGARGRRDRHPAHLLPFVTLPGSQASANLRRAVRPRWYTSPGK